MDRYDKYKPSGVTWIDEIPFDWNFTKTKYAFRYTTGFTPPTGNEEFYNGNIVWVTIRDMNRRIVSDSSTKLTQLAIDTFQPDITLKGSLLFSFKLSVGKVAFAGTDLYTNEAIISILPSDEYDVGFLYYALTDQLLQTANENIYGAKILNQELIRNAFILLPAPQEQSLIAEYLGEKTQNLDKVIFKKQELIELLQEERKALINQAATKGLSPNVTLKPSGIEFLGSIPEPWQVKKLKYLTSRIGDGIHATPTYVNYSDIYFINGNNLSQGKIVITESTRCMDENEYARLDINFENGAIFLSINGTIGNLALYTGETVVLGKSAAYIECMDTLLNKFAYYVFQTSAVENYFEASLSGTTIKNLSLHTLRNTKFPVPPFEEQLAIVHYIESKSKEIDSTVLEITKEIDLMIEYRAALISEAVTGKIKVVQPS